MGSMATFSAADPAAHAWPRGSYKVQRAGAAICGGMFRFVCWALPSDLEFLGNELQFPHFNGYVPCWNCSASRVPGTPCPLTDVRLNAAWKGTLVDHLDGARRPVSQHPLILHLKGFTRWHVPGDLQHSDDLGVLLWLEGAVLDELLYDGPLSGNPAQRCAQPFSIIQTAYESNAREGINASTRLSALNPNMLPRPGKFSCLAAKAAEARTLLPCLLRVCRELHTGSDRDEHRVRALQSITNMYAVFEVGDIVLTDNEADEAVRGYENFLLHHNALLHLSLARNVKN